MKFCEICDNMLYIQAETDTTHLKLYCKNCNYSRLESPKEMGDTCVAIKNFASDANSYKNYMTPSIKHDPTLPRVNNIKCPENCKAEKNEVIYIKHDHDNMKYLYFCTNCNHFWKS